MPSVVRGIAYLQTIENTRIVLNTVRGLEIRHNTRGVNDSSIRAFVQQRLPILRFHNPQLTLKLEIAKNLKKLKPLMLKGQPKQVITKEEQEAYNGDAIAVAPTITVLFHNDPATNAVVPPATIDGAAFKTCGALLQQLLIIDKQPNLIPAVKASK